MHLKEGINLNDFLNEIEECKEDVYFKSPEGDNLNLKSQLSRYVLAIAVNNKEFLLSGTITCSNNDDYKLLEKYITEA